ncbi:MAG: caspase family protein, partial [Solirubrobacteraceae bacterium]
MNAQVPLRRALLVATGTYGDPGLAGLEAPQSDVEALAEVLGDGSIGRFEVQELVDRPTEEIKRAIEGFFGIARPHELLLLYFSGHGVLSQSRRFFFATSTTVLEYLRTTAIEDSFVNGAMHESRAKSIVLILDCCHSGAFGRGMTPKSALMVDVQHRFLGRGRVTLSASTELQYAFEEADPATGINELVRPPPGSLFTSCLVNGLRTGEADTNEDGEISVDELYDYACQRVRQRSPHQTPGMAGDVRGDIVIAHSTRRPALAPVLVQTIDSPLAGLREGAVTELERLVRSGPPPVAEVARQALE